MTEDTIDRIGLWTLFLIALLGVLGLILFCGITEHQKSMAAIERGVVWSNHSDTGYRPAVRQR